MVEEKELRAVYHIFTDVWKLYRKYADAKEDGRYWEELAFEAGVIAKRYGNSKLCRDLLIAVLLELERKGKEGA